MNTDIMVSIICNAFNHEKYIRKTLDGFVNQKTKFTFEILVHDDASTDGTADIIRDFEKRFPDLIKPIYQTTNQYSIERGRVARLQRERAKGKYIALCEGDDFWTDYFKLQKQVDALENNPSCHFCVCSTEIVNEDGTTTGKSFPKTFVPHGIIKSRDFMKLTEVYNFHTSSYLMSSELYVKYNNESPKFKTVTGVGDEPLLLFFGFVGDVYYIADKMSCYRTNSVSSWSRNFRAKKENNLKHFSSLIDMVNEFDIYSNFVYHDICENRIQRIKFNISLINKNFDEIFNNENKRFYKNLPVKQRYTLLLERFFPTVYRFSFFCYNKLRKK